MKLLILSIYYNLCLFFRIKQVLFFALIFPIFLFVLFISIWGTDNPLYINFILTGVLGMTLMNEGLFTIGPTLRDYKTTNFIQYLQRMPNAVMPYFVGLIISRVLVMLLVTSIMLIVSIFWNAELSWIFISRIFIFIILGMFIFSFIGLILAFTSLKSSVGRNLTNLVQVLILFISDTFYPASQINPVIGFIGNLLPLNPVLMYARGGVFTVALFFWLIIPPVVFYLLFKKTKHDR